MSLLTVPTIPPVSGGSGGDSWTSNSYELDFTAEANLDIDASGDGDIAIDGNTWTADKMAYTADFQIINGTGLQMVNTGTRHWETATTSRGPNIHILISDLIATYTDERQVVDLQLLLANDVLVASYVQAVFGVMNKTALPGETLGDAITMKAGFNNGGVEAIKAQRHANNGLTNDVFNTGAGKTRVLGMRILNPNAVEIYYSADANDYGVEFSGGSWADAKDSGVPFISMSIPPQSGPYFTPADLAVVIGKAGSNAEAVHVEKLKVKVWSVLE